MVARPLLCTGGPTLLKHTVECGFEPVQRIAQGDLSFDQCPSSSRFRLLSLSGHYACRESSFRARCYHPPLFDHMWARDAKWFIHKPCACNHMNALFGRVGKCIPPPNPIAIQQILTPIAARLALAVGRHHTIPYRDVYVNMCAKKRARYRRAEAVLASQGGRVTSRQCRVNMFVKMEAISMTKVNPDCRAIQFRSYEYTLSLASKIKLAEHGLYNLRDVPGFGTGRLFAKGMDARAKADALLQMDRPGWHRLELDASRWDAHLSPELLSKVEHEFWRLTCSPSVRQLLQKQLTNKGGFRVRTETGEFRAKYSVKGGRMSGDANTAGGNCIIMCCLLVAFGEHLIQTARITQFDFLDDGDDSVFVHDGEEVADSVVEDFFRQFGIVMAIENRPKRFEDINFCQAKPVQLGTGWTMVRNPMKIMSKIGVSPKLTHGRHRYLMTVALGELSMVRGCPVLQPFLLRVIQQCKLGITRDKDRLHRGAISDNWRLQQLSAGDWVEGSDPITPEARNSFHRAWGMDVKEQLLLERALESWTFDLGKTRAGEGVDFATWRFPWMKPEEW